MPSPFQHGGAEECHDVAGTSSVPWEVDNNHGYMHKGFQNVPPAAQTTLEISPEQDVLGIESSHHGKDLRLCDHNPPGISNSRACIDKFGVRWENDCSILRKSCIQPRRERRSKNLPNRSILRESDLQFCVNTNCLGNHNMLQESGVSVEATNVAMSGDGCLSSTHGQKQQELMQADSIQHSNPLSSHEYYQYGSDTKVPCEKHDCLGSPQSILYHGIFSNSARVLVTSGRCIPESNFARFTSLSVEETDESVDFEIACSEEGDRLVPRDSMIFPFGIEDIDDKVLPHQEDECGRSSILPEHADSMEASLGHIGAFSSKKHNRAAESVNFESDADSFVNKSYQQQKLDNTSCKSKGFVDRHGVRWTGDCEYLTRPVDSVVPYHEELRAGSKDTSQSCPHFSDDKDVSSWRTSQIGVVTKDASRADANVNNDIDLNGGCQTHLQLFNSCSRKKELIHVPATAAIDPMDSGPEHRVGAVVNKKVSIHCPSQTVLPILKVTRIKFRHYGWTEVQASWSFMWKAWQWNRPSLLAARTTFRQLVALLKVAGGCIGGMFKNAERGLGS